MTRDHDEVVRSALRDLRAADEHEAMPFAEACEPRLRLRSVDPWRAIKVAVAASMLIAAGVDGARRVQAWRTRIVVPAEVRELSSWRPMTEGLLLTPNAGVLTQTSAFTESILPMTPILEDDE